MGQQLWLGLYTLRAGIVPWVEVSGPGYARVELRMVVKSQGVSVNFDEVVFPKATGAWTPVNGFLIYDAQEKLIYRGDLDQGVLVIHVGDRVIFTPENLRILGEPLTPGILFPEGLMRRTLWDRLNEEGQG